MRGIVALIVVIAIIGGVFCVCSMERIGAGEVGVVYSMKGGVEDETLSQGWHIVAPTKKVKEFTISNEQLLLEDKEVFKVATSDDASINISFQMSYRFYSD